MNTLLKEKKIVYSGSKPLLHQRVHFVTQNCDECFEWQEVPHEHGIVINLISDRSFYNAAQLKKLKKTSRLGLIESVTRPSRNSIIKDKVEEINEIYKLIGFTNTKVLELCFKIIQIAIELDILTFNVSRTIDNELLFFTEFDNSFNNIIIDNDCDIEFLHISKDRKQSYNEHYEANAELQIYDLVSKLK